MSTGAPAAGGAGAAPSNGAASQTQAPASNAPAPATADQKTPAQASPPKPEQPWKAKRKLKLNGQDVEREYDDRRLQILEHEYQRKGDTDKRIADFEAQMRRMQDDPDGFFAERGFDVETYLAQRAQRAEAMKQLSPEQRRIQELESQIARAKQAEQQRAQAEEKAKAEQADRDFVASNTRLYGQVMQLAGMKPGSPGTGSFLSNMATVRTMAHQNGEPDLTPDQLLAHTERFEANMLRDMLSRKLANEGWRGRNGESMQALAKAVLTALDGDALLDWVGADFVKKVLKAQHGRLHRSPVPIVQETPPAPQPNGAAPVAGKQRDEWDVLDGLGG